MNSMRTLLLYVLLSAFGALIMGGVPSAQAQQSPAAASVTAKQIGTVKSIVGKTLVMKTDSGPDVSVQVQDSTRIVRIAPGQTSLKDATPIEFSDLQVGDRILARGTAGDAQSVVAALVVVMKQTDVAQKQEHEQEDWQKRGVGGIITAVDPAAKTITVSIVPGNNISIKTSNNTRYLRYAPDSIKFNDARPGSFDDIKTGDQLRARGTRSADGKEFAADEIISGSFRNIAGTIISVDASRNTLSVMDVFKKKPVTVNFTTDSQLRKVPLPLAQRMAMVLKGGVSSRPASAQSADAKTGAPAAAAPESSPAGGSRPAGAAGAGRPGGSPDVQQFLNRLPAVTLADLQKGDAVMIVSTQGTETSDVKAITLLSGVEPILTASPTGSATAAVLSAWNMSGGGGDTQ
ncbi:MAG TPA: DUF5666 domain-containing protein [Terriglobales bacterium]|nr:DUF5666 domain-containing protein [Terriglobales bacterium]